MRRLIAVDLLDHGTLVFHPGAPPTDEDVQRAVTRGRRRLERRGLVGVTVTDEADPLAEESVALAGLSQAAVLGAGGSGQAGRAGPTAGGRRPGRAVGRAQRATSRARWRLRPSRRRASRRRRSAAPRAALPTSVGRRSANSASSGCATGASP